MNGIENVSNLIDRNISWKLYSPSHPSLSFPIASTSSNSRTHGAYAATVEQMNSSVRSMMGETDVAREKRPIVLAENEGLTRRKFKNLRPSNNNRQ